MLKFTAEEQDKIENCIEQIEQYCKDNFVPKLHAGESVFVHSEEWTFYVNKDNRIEFSGRRGSTLYLGASCVSQKFSDRVNKAADLIHYWGTIKAAVRMQLEDMKKRHKEIENFQV